MVKLYRYVEKKELNNYELDNMVLSYKNLFRKDDNLILCNNIANDYDYLEQVSGFNDDDDYLEIYQYYIIDDELAKNLIDIDELVFYHNKLDLYVLGVCHYGTSWGYIASGLKLKIDETDETNNWYYAYYEKD